MGSRLEKRSSEVRKRIQNHQFDGEDGEEYKGSTFGGFGDYFRRKKLKLQNLDVETRERNADNPQIFKGIVAHVNGYTQPTLQDLHKMIVSHGGGFMQYLDGKTMVTHVIASNLTPKKAVEFSKYRIVKPAWIVDSIEAGKLLPWTSYRAVDEGSKQKVLGFENGRMIQHQSAFTRSYKEQTDASWYSKQMNHSQFKPTATSTSFSDSDDLVLDDVELDNGKPLSNRNMVSSPASQFRGRNSQPDEIEEADNKVPTSAQHPSPNSKSVFTPTPPSPKPISLDGDEDELPEPIMQHGLASSEPMSRDESAVRDGTSLGSPRVQVPSSPRADQSSKALKRSLESEPVEDPVKRTKLTAEEHNAMILADPNIRKSTVLNPGFLEQYYKESRLHHLSTWRADIKSEMQALADASSLSQKRARKPKTGTRRYIMHVDFDCFFAAVSAKKFPEYKGKPAVVAHGTGSGSEIASCNYEARAFGVKNGMWMKRALELCPELKVLPYDFPEYENASRAFYEHIIAVGGLVQSVSVDEALVDVSNVCHERAGTDGKSRDENGVEREQHAAGEIGMRLREAIKVGTGCEVSVGIGGSILLAKLALRKAKPAGQYHLRPEQVHDFMELLEVSNLPGFAHSFAGKLEEVGIKFVRDVRASTKEKLINTLGPKTGEKLWEYSRGIDKKEVGDVEIRKSVSAEVNWGVRFETREQVDEFIANLCGELQRRLLKERVKGRHFTLKIMKRAATAPLDPPKHLGHGICDTFNKSTSLGIATNSKATMTTEALSMLKSMGFSPGELRGIGVQMTKLGPITATNAESSQKLLQFKSVPYQQNQQAPPPRQPPEFKTRPEDPIEEATTPKKPKESLGKILFGADQLNQLTPSRKLLNTKGTQFLLPSQSDSQVVKQLPQDVRSRLMAASQSKQGASKPTTANPFSLARASPPPPATLLPTKSQIDAETFAALPADMQQEILAFYDDTDTSEKNPRPRATGSGRVSPAKPAGPSNPKGRGKASKASVGTLTQSNFISTHFAHAGAEPALPQDPDVPPLSPGFLEALPSSLQEEIIRDHRQKVIRARNRRAAREKKLLERNMKKLRPPRRKLHLPERLERPTFTAKRICTVGEMREALDSWVGEFGDEGPYDEDVECLTLYLGKVVREEGDMEKAVAVSKWLGFVVEDMEGAGKRAWERAVDRVGAALQQAVKDRGLGRVKL